MYAVTACCYMDTAPSKLYTLSLHDALPICLRSGGRKSCWDTRTESVPTARATCTRRSFWPTEPRSSRQLEGHREETRELLDRKSTRLNSSHVAISYAVFCLK